MMELELKDNEWDFDYCDHIFYVKLRTLVKVIKPMLRFKTFIYPL